MPMRRRSFLGLGAAGAAGLGLSLLNAPGARAAAPTQPFAIGVRDFNWSRGSRQLFTRIFYPISGTPGGEPVRNAPIAGGVFPVVEWSHGLGGNSDSYASQVRALVSAGFVVPAPSFPNSSPQETYNGNQSRDVSEVISRTLALNTTSGDMFAGRLNTGVGVGAAGHSLGGMTTHGLLTAWPDPRVVAAVPVACVDMGNPSSSVKANVLFIHGENDGTCPYSSARQAYSELPAPKAFLTHVGADHGSYLVPGNPTYNQTQNTFLDWFRWRLYDDTAARDRLTADATSGGTRWEADLAARPSSVISLRSRANNQYVCAENAGGSPLIANRTAIGPWERFDLVDLGGGAVALRAQANGQYVCAENAGGSPLIANRTAIGPWETFQRVNNADGSISLRAQANNQYVSAPNGGANPLVANATSIGPSESFDLISG
ncbi:poly(ethylene terephthalate) hydrolase family protein [Streptomyces litchfieldiae]|uniref:Alpha/beta hydrolase n=1 Tax=Streptomyces litchfieldiae TaxID=3075543 RepID=A0ABU2N0Z0_9ACTN|nr:alpha/beta hydrolase [Streptomyces sp. DSM 44938]MDT0347416.1 alpha/beta hydrolase [Streptomyces sp. DSM 44938]